MYYKVVSLGVIVLFFLASFSKANQSCSGIQTAVDRVLHEGSDPNVVKPPLGNNVTPETSIGKSGAVQNPNPTNFAAKGNQANSNPLPAYDSKEISEHFKFNTKYPDDVSDAKNMFSDTVSLIRKGNDPKFNEGAELMLDYQTKALQSKSYLDNNESLKIVMDAKRRLLNARLNRQGDARGMSLEDVESGIEYLTARLSKVDPKLLKPPSPYDLEQKLLNELKESVKAKREHRARELISTQNSQARKAEKFAEELKDRSSGPVNGQILTSADKDSLSQLTQLLNNNPNQLTKNQVQQILEMREKLKQKQAFKNDNYSGMIPEDDKATNLFASALDSAVKKINQGSSKAYSLAESHGDKIKLATVEKNIHHSNGKTTRETVTSASAASKAKPDLEIIKTDLTKASPGQNRGELNEHLKFRPVIKDGQTMKEIFETKLKGVFTKKEIDDANFASTLDLQGVEKFSGSHAFEFVEKIDELKATQQWDTLFNRLSKDEKDKITNLYERVHDHYINFRRPDILNLPNY